MYTHSMSMQAIPSPHQASRNTPPHTLHRSAALSPHQDVQARGLQQSNLVSNAEGGKAGKAFGKLYYLDDAFGGQFAEFVP